MDRLAVEILIQWFRESRRTFMARDNRADVQFWCDVAGIDMTSFLSKVE